MWYIPEDKDNKIEESYTPEWVWKVEQKIFIPTILPWVNSPQIDQTISVDI